MLESLRSIVQEVNSAPDLETALTVTVRRIREVMGTEVASIFLVDRISGRYVFMATEGLNRASVGKVSLAPDEGLVAQVGQRSEPLNLEDAVSHPSFHLLPEIGEERYHAFLGVPIIHHRRVLGVLVVQQQARRRFDENEEAFLVTLSAQLAGAIAHAEATGAIQDLGTGDEGPHWHDAKFDGVAGAPGVAIGTAVVLGPPALLDAVPDRQCNDIMVELLLFERAIEAVRTEIRDLGAKLSDSLGPEERALFDAYLHMLDDNAIAGEVNRLIRDGHWAQGALRRVINEHLTHFELLEDSYLRERANDVKGLGERVLAHLQDVSRRKSYFPDNTILVGEDVTPTVMSEVPAEKLAGIVSMKGSSNSHMAILARGMGLPAVMGAVDLPANFLDNHELVVDGFNGEVHVNPSPRLRQHYQSLIETEHEFADKLDELRDLPCVTPDGHLMPLWVNTGLDVDIRHALERGAEGVGLFRTEIPFMSKERFPTEEEQRVLYRRHLEAFSPRPVNMRTLDIGGDKILSYFPMQEDNPFLGWRGIRVTLDHPEIFVVQVRAMIKAGVGLEGSLRIMLPLITTISEVEESMALVYRCFDEIVEEGLDVQRPRVGVMIEVPAAVYQAKQIAERTDFLAVGSNDLTQYMLAVDRNNPQVANLYQELHPSVLCALRDIALAAGTVGKHVSICGELAGNPMGAVLLMAMGYDVLSMNSTNLTRVKWVIRNTPFERAKALLEAVLGMDTPDAIKKFMRDELVGAGLGRAVIPEPGAVA
ncbi:MAG: phosphoenolpyruvate--protein phosphotransferase [Pseudomonadales bacterium]